MKKIFLSLTFLLSSFCYGVILNNDASEVLNHFFRTMILHSEGGYVLLNQKPICINGFYMIDRFSGECCQHRESVDLREGAVVWKKIQQSELNNILIHIYNVEDSRAKNYIHILFINKNLFYQTVEKNLSLFQYVLGPSVTPELLLNKLTLFDENFHTVLKNDNVLIGILLGFGTQNSLFGSRLEYLQEQLLSCEHPPMKNIFCEVNSIYHFCKENLLNTIPNNCPAIYPQASFAYSSPKEELFNLIESMEVSSSNLSQKKPYFIFGKIKEDRETKHFIPELEKKQIDLASMLSSSNFLKDVFEKIFPGQDLAISKLQLSDYHLKFTPSELEQLPSLVGMSILNNLEGENVFFVQGFLLGMKDSNNNVKSLFTDDGESTYDKMKALKAAQENIRQADFYFSGLDNKQELTCIVPKKLYYRSLQKGDGIALNEQMNVTIHCKIETPESFVITDTWANNQPMKIDMENIIPGFTLGISGMRIGEIRELYIHPSLGYGIYTFLEKGIHLKVQVQLIAINRKESHSNTPSVNSFDFDKDFAILDEQNYDEISKKAGYLQGYDIWGHYKKVNFYNLEQVLFYIDQLKNTQFEKNYEVGPNQDLLNHLHWIIYHKDNE